MTYYPLRMLQLLAASIPVQWGAYLIGLGQLGRIFCLSVMTFLFLEMVGPLFERTASSDED